MRPRTHVWEGVQLGVIAVMFITAVVRWSSVPNRIPIHWNSAGEVDGYGSKFVGLLLIPLLSFGVYLLLAFVPRIDPARANYSVTQGVYLGIRVSVVLYLGCVYAITNLAIGNEESVPVAKLILISVSLLLVFIGSVMGKLRPNYVAGIRTPWTLTSKKSWVKTQRLGGWVFIACGLISTVAALFSELAAIIAMLGVMGIGILVLLPYSYFVWKDDLDRVAAQDTQPA